MEPAFLRDDLKDALVAGSIAAVLSGAPSTFYSAATTGDVFEATRAAGAMVLPNEERSLPLLAAAIPVHVGLSLGWALCMVKVLPRKYTVLWGAAFGAAIAAFDLGVVGHRIPAIGALPQAPQVADHVAFGLVVAFVVRRRRERRETDT